VVTSGAGLFVPEEQSDGSLVVYRQGSVKKEVCPVRDVSDLCREAAIQNSPGLQPWVSWLVKGALKVAPDVRRAGAYSVVEIVAERGHGTPVHIHENEDEHFVVVQGTVHMMRGDETFDATAGAAISLRKGIPHPWCNRSDAPLRLVITNVPGGIEEALRSLATGADIPAVSEQFAVRVVGPMI
jgi:mannose-6-phosphate isomerase-like protein (cupin superfamily)